MRRSVHVELACPDEDEQDGEDEETEINKNFPPLSHSEEEELLYM